MLLCSCKVSSIARNAITSLHETLTHTPNILSEQISKLRRSRHKKHHKTSHGDEKFFQNLRASKMQLYQERNCKSGRHSQYHTFLHNKSQNKNTSTNIPNLGLEIRGRKQGETKFPSSRRRDQMRCDIHHCQNNNRQERTNISQPCLPYNEPDL